MAVKTAAIRSRAVTAPSPAKTGNAKAVQRKILPSLRILPSPIQRKEQSGNWLHQQPLKAVKGRNVIQPKVKVHASNDHFEKEADHVADKVVNAEKISSSTRISSVGTGTQRKSFAQKKTIQTKTNSARNNNNVLHGSDSGPPASPDLATPHPLEKVLSNQSTRGSPLPSSTRSVMENRMGADFSHVRIHNGQESHDANASIGARAFTNGGNIHFANSQYNPNTRTGQHLLAHELTHTIQQGASPSSASPGAVQRSKENNSFSNITSESLSDRGPPIQRQTAQATVQCSLIDNAIAHISDLLDDLPSLSGGLEGAKQWLIGKMRQFASFIPGYTALGVVLGQEPITGQRIERNGRNFINAALDIIPGGGLLKQKLEELGAIDRAAAWIDVQLETLSGIVANVREEFNTEWNRLGIRSFLDGPLNILRTFGGIFERAINNLISFAGRAASELLSIVKQYLLTQIVNFIKNHTNAYELLKVIIGHDPITEEQVARNGTNILNALLELGGEQGREQRRQMQDTGTFQKAADWIDRGIAVFGNLYETIRNNFGLIWNVVSIQSLMDPVGTFNQIYTTFAEPVRQVLSFVADTLQVILGFIKEVLLQRLSAWARTVRGYQLVTVLIGKDPFTNQSVPRSIPNIIRGFMSLMEGGEEQYRQMEESGAIGRAAQQIDAAVARLNMTPASILQLFIDLWNSFSFNDLAHPIAAFQRIIARFGEPIGRLIAFIVEIVKIVVHVILQIMNFPFDLINSIISRAMAAFERIKQDPIGFLKNLMRAIKQGFIQFFDNIVTHLINGVVGWLMSELRDANIPELRDFSLRGVIAWILQVLGISMEAIWQKLAAHPRIGPERVARIRSMINTLEGIWTFIQDVQQRGMAAIWDKIQEQLSNLWNTVLDAVKNWIMERIVTAVTTKLLSMLDPTGIMAVINSAIAIYRAVQSFIRYLRQMLEVVNSFVGGIADIAEGNITTAANALERTMGRAMPIVIGFLANQVGLSGIGRRIGEMITAARQMVDRALTWLVNKAVDTGFSIIDRLMSMGRSAVGAVLGWLGYRKEFRTQAGETHSLYFQGTGENAELIMASEPRRYKQHLDQLDAEGKISPAQRPQFNQAKTKIDELNRLKRDQRRTGDTSADNTNITNLVNDIANLTSTFLSGGLPVSTMPIYHLGVNAAGFSKGVKVEKLTKNGPAGSAPSASNSVWETLNFRRQGGRSFYVRGHLLSNYYHGSGSEWRNLVPMFQNHNTAFETKVESRVKSKYDANGILYFEVVVDYGRPVNPNKAAILASETDAAKQIKLERVINAEVNVPSTVTLVVDEYDPATNQRKMNSIIEEVNMTNLPAHNYSDYSIQTKLKVSGIGDHHEREADHIADRVISNEKISSPSTISKVSGGIQRKTNSSERIRAPGNAVSSVLSTQSTRGSPLPSPVRSQMESRIGADFSNVRIHTGAQSEKANAAIGSRAFTQGSNIHFGKGEFNPQTKSGQHLLAHELVHTMQQGAAPSKRISSSSKGSGKTASITQSGKKNKSSALAKIEKAIAADKQAPAQAADATKTAAGKSSSKKSPSSPEEDPAFQQTIKRAKKRTGEQKDHGDPGVKADDAQNAAKAVPYEAESKAQNRKTDDLHDAGKEDKLFDAASFKADLLAKITEITPNTLEEADEFKEKNRIHEVKDAMSSKVATEKQATTGPLNKAAAEKLEVKDNENKKSLLLPPTDKGVRPSSIGAKNAVPKQKTDDEISMQEQSASLDEEMKQNNISEDQLQGSNEPSFQSALKEKRNAQKDAVEKPLQYRKDEGMELKEAETEAGGKAGATLAGMYSTRGKKFGETVIQQNASTKRDEDSRAKVADDINKKYLLTEKAVNDFLTQAETLSNGIFEQGAEDARKLFEDYADKKMRAYKAERYSGWLGGGRWLKDKFFDLPGEVNVFYEDGKKLYLDKMDKVLTDVANIVAEKLNNAKKAITDGKKEIDDYVKKLPDDVADVGKEAAELIGDKFQSLEQNVNDKGHQLIDSFAKKYVDNLKKLDDRIHELKEANKGLISKAIGLLKEVWKAIKNIYNLFKTILSKLVQIVGIIIGAPGKFFGNLGAAFSKGFDMFKSRLDEHLENGLMTWISTQLGVADLKLPDKFDIASIFGLVLQVMGISYAHIRERAVLQIGEERVGLLETTAGVFQRIYKEGLGAVWEIIKEKFTDFKEMIWEAIKTFIRDSVIKAAITFLLSLLNPIAAFVKACMAIYDFLMLLVRMKDRIIDLINSILDAVMTIAQGSVDSAAAAIEKAFAKSIPIIIGFLAALLHLNNIGAKVRDLILRIREKVDKLIDWLIGKAYSLVGPAVELAMRAKNKGKELIQKGKEKVMEVGESAVGAVAGWLGLKQNFRGNDGKDHSLYFKGTENDADLMIASTPMSYREFLGSIHVDSTDTAKVNAKNHALDLASEIAREKSRPYPPGISDAQKEPLKRAKRQQLQLLLGQLQIHSSILLAGTNAPSGKSKEDPIPFVWFKHEHYYDKKINLPRLGFANIERNDQQPLPLNFDGHEMKLGIKEKYWPHEGKIFQFIPTDRGNKVSQFRDILSSFGYDWAGLDADHVQDLKYEGRDHESNIWPMDNSANRSAGARQNSQIVIYKNDAGNIVPIDVGNMILAGRFFKIIRIQM